MSSSFATALDVDLDLGRPPLVRAEGGGDAPGWAAEHRDAVRGVVMEHGAAVIRGLGLREAIEVGSVFRRLAGAGLMSDREAFATRRAYGEGVYSSVKWPANQPMCMHHELSYAFEFPGLMLFACLNAPADGGAVGMADAPTVLEALPSELTARFEQEGWLLVRNFDGDVGASVVEAFGTNDRTSVERYCRANAIDLEWRPDGGLRTTQRRRAVVSHPVTGRRCWFNQVAFLNEWTMDPEVREFLVEVYGADRLPFTTRFGDGDPIAEDAVTLINEVYRAVTVREPWRRGDLMVVDNIRTAHSREPFTGPREVLVGMADPVRLPALGVTTE